MKLQNVRISRGLSQSQLAEKANMSVRTLQNYETGYRSIENANLSTLCRLAVALNCQLVDLVESEELIDLLNKLK